MKEDLLEGEISDVTPGVNVEKVVQNEESAGVVEAWHGGKIRDAIFGKLPVMVVIFHHRNREVELRYARIRNPVKVHGKEYYYDPYTIEHYGAFACVSVYEQDPYAYYPDEDPELKQDTIKEAMQLEIMNRAKLQAHKRTKWDFVMQYVLIAVIILEAVFLWLK